MRAVTRSQRRLISELAGTAIGCLLVSLALVAALGAVAAVVTWWLSDLAMAFVGGSDFAEIQDHLWLFAVLAPLDRKEAQALAAIGIVLGEHGVARLGVLHGAKLRHHFGVGPHGVQRRAVARLGHAQDQPRRPDHPASSFAASGA